MTEDESTEAMQTYAAGLSILDMRPIRTPEVDWPQLVLALLMHRDRSGRRMSATQIAKVTICEPRRIRQLRIPGTQPRHSLGQRLVMLHERVIGPAPVVSADQLRKKISASAR